MFYVYVYYDPRPGKNGVPVYVGKGCGKRSHKHLKYGNHRNPIFGAWLKAVATAGLTPIIKIDAYFEHESEAFSHEKTLIAKFGRKDRATGTLCNCTDGGEGPSGQSYTPEKLVRKGKATADGWAKEETRRKRVEGIKASRTPELRAQLSASCSALWDDETRAVQSAKMKQILASPEMKAQRSAQLRARPIKPPKAVVAIRPSGEREVFRSLLEAMEITSVADSVLRKLLAGGTLKKGAFVGWGFEYLDTPLNP